MALQALDLEKSLYTSAFGSVSPASRKRRKTAAGKESPLNEKRQWKFFSQAVWKSSRCGVCLSDCICSLGRVIGVVLIVLLRWAHWAQMSDSTNCQRAFEVGLKDSVWGGPYETALVQSKHRLEGLTIFAVCHP